MLMNALSVAATVATLSLIFVVQGRKFWVESLHFLDNANALVGNPVHVLPDNFALSVDFQSPAVLCLCYEQVPVG